MFEEDKGGILHYDVIVPKDIAENNKALYDALTHDTHPWNTPYNAYTHYNNKPSKENQDNFMLTGINLAGKEFVVRGDNNGNFYYDLQITDEMPSIIKDNKKATKRTNPLTLGGVIGSFDDNDNQTDSLSQDFL